MGLSNMKYGSFSPVTVKRANDIVHISIVYLFLYNVCALIGLARERIICYTTSVRYY